MPVVTPLVECALTLHVLIALGRHTLLQYPGPLSVPGGQLSVSTPTGRERE
jgi:hypothetical protein